MAVCKKNLDFYHNNVSPDKPNLKLPLFLQILENQRDSHGRKQSHDCVELVIVLRGSGTLVCNDFKRDISMMDVVVIPPGAAHCYENTDALSVANILFDRTHLPMPKLDLPLLPGYHTLFMLHNDFFENQHTIPGFTLTGSQFSGIKQMLLMMHGECEHQRQGCNFRIMGMFMTILGHLAAIYPDAKATSRPDKTDSIGNLIAFMNKEFHRKITYAEMLKKVPMSRSTLLRNFHRATGVTPMRYLLNLRLEHASKLLSISDMSIAEIAEASGFDDSNYFSRAFSKTYQLSPRAYRQLPIPVLDC